MRNAVQQKPDMIEAWRANIKVEEHDKNLPVRCKSSKITELDEKDVDSRYACAFILQRTLNEALKLSNAAVEIDPKNLGALATKAATLFRLKDIDGATQTAKKALEIDPGNVDAGIILASVSFLQGDSDAALKILANVSPAKQEDLGVMFLKINIFQRKGDFPQVEALLRRLIVLHPTEPQFRPQLVRFYVTQKRPDDAVNELRSVVTANPADFNAEIQLVNLLGAIKGVPAARDELVARIKAGGAVLGYQIALANLEFEQGNIEDATQLLKKIISESKSPSDVINGQTTLAELYMKKNNVAAAEPVIADVLAKDSRNIVALRLRATIRMDRGQIDDAINDLRTALNDQPRAPDLLVTMAIAYERAGSIELADKD